MFSSASFRMGPAAFSGVSRQANFQKHAALFRHWNSRTGTVAKKSTTPSTSVKIAIGLSGVLLIGGLDCVAPSSYPFQDQAAGVEAKTYWNSHTSTSTPPPTTSNPQRSPILPTTTTTPHSYNVVIVGGGMAGLHTALALAERSPKNTKIVILDAHHIGQSASGRSKGLVVPGLQVEQEDLERICGSSIIAQQVYEMTHQAAKRLKHEIVQKYKINCSWVDTGHVEATLHEDGGEEEEEDDGCHALTAAEVRRLLGQPESSTLYKGGELDTSCCGVDPLALTQGLAEVLEKQYKVKIGEQTRVTKIEKLTTESDNGKYTVTTDSGAQIHCQHVVLCTGPELVSKELSQRLQHAVIPIYTWMAATAPLGDDCPLQNGVLDDYYPKPTSNWTKKQQTTTLAPMCGDDFVCLNYWRRTDDGRLLFGSLADAYPVPQWLAEYRLRKALQQVYPQLENVQLEQVWGGRLAFPRDAVPLIGRDEGWDHVDASATTSPSDGGVWYATGFGGHGIVPTVMAGSILADAILGKDDQTWRLFHREFPPQNTFWPFSQIGAQALLSLYNAFDWLHVKGAPVPQLPKPW